MSALIFIIIFTLFSSSFIGICIRNPRNDHAQLASFSSSAKSAALVLFESSTSLNSFFRHYLHNCSVVYIYIVFLSLFHSSNKNYMIFIIFTLSCFFFINFPAKSNGPFRTLSESIQRSPVELLFYVPSLDDKLLQAIISCCQDGKVKVSVSQYILQVLHYRCVFR